jgi:phage terminase small subunit
MRGLDKDAQSALAELSEGHQAFVLNYATWNGPTFRNATQSYRLAGYTPKSDKSATAAAIKLLVNHSIKEAILYVERSTRGKLEEVTLVDAAWLHRRLSLLANSTPLDYGTITADGGFKVDLRKVAARPELASAIERIKVRRSAQPELWGDEIELTLVSRLKTFELVGKHIQVQAFSEKLDINDSRQGSERARAAEARMKERAERSLKLVRKQA